MAGQLEQIFVLLREQTGHDFAHEELETSKEELQSVNEQLMTVNNELQEKLEELWQANNDLTNPLNTEIGTIFLDNDLRIERFTPAVTKLVQVNQASYTMFHARKEDILGARLSDLVSGRWDRGDLRKRLDTVIAGGAPLDGFEVVQDLPKLGRRTLKLYATRTAFGGKAVAGEEELTFLTIEDATGAKAREARGNGDGEARGG
jgi:PAS domain-containing protein